MKIGDTELEEKIGRITEMLQREDLAGVLLNAQHNFAWLTGGGSNGIDLSRENGAAAILITAGGGRYLLANNIERQRLMTEQIPPAAEFEPVEFPWQQEKAEPGVIFETACSIANGSVASDLPIDPRARVIEGSIAKCRFRLTVQEADRIRQLGRDAGAAIDRLPARIAPGETESGIAEKFRAELAAGGMTSVVTLVAADERIGLFRHPVPTGRRWEKVLLLVTCAKRGGLIVSLSRMICSGPVPGPLQRKTEACAFVNASLLKATLPGTTGAELYQAAADAYRTAGCGAEIDLHHQGGAGGYKTREWVAHPQSREVVHADQPFAWNPSITGTKVEETVLTRDDSIEVLTASTLFPSIATEIGNRTFLSPGILSL